MLKMRWLVPGLLFATTRAQLYVQWGHTRTATTFQFELVCAAAAMLHGPNTACRYISHSKPYLNTTIKGPTVVKTHDLGFREEMRTWQNFKGFFVTETDSQRGHGAVQVGDACRADAQNDESRGATYAQSMEKLFFRKFTIVYDYQRPLGLTDQQTADLAEYMRYWEILRRCCGSQMSKDFSARLLGRKRTRDDADVAFDMCEAYDISAVESMLMGTRIYRDFSPTIDLVARLSTYDQHFDGSYCLRSQVATKKCRLVMNDKRIKKLLTMPDQTPFLHDDGDFSTMSTSMRQMCTDFPK
mmetsp:Transcript_18654/g.57345  ORF Transcript_18654/g.57345 Transcript_18654/m.57345 type:complete len:299 (-) Transcript_18654:53-949(-)